MQGKKIHVTGVVQGVGFRPFVYQVATRAHLKGWVANTSAGVDIEVEGDEPALREFVRALTEEKPPLAQIDAVDVQDIPANGHARFAEFEIRASVALTGAFQPISPDISICSDCLRELFDPNDRRYRYPFINCTNCGPRFTIIADIPYDRPKTTMAPFAMCPACAAEYADPLNRRFHAQPVACPECGPKVWLEANSKFVIQNSKFKIQSPNYELRITNYDAIEQTRQLLARGAIVAVKGLGGFHLACDAMNASAVAELRRRKLRVDKPFALMMPDLATVEQHCHVDAEERALLESRERPIVLVKRRLESKIAAQVAPGQDRLGIMLPYTPLHYLLLASPPSPNPLAPLPNLKFSSGEARGGKGVGGEVLVMTSGNLSEEPIATDNDEARARLAGLADAFLMHDRGIHTRCDDSVVRVITTPTPTPGPSPVSRGRGEGVAVIRRSRGYAPFPVHLPFEAPPILATGAELKNTFCLTRDRYAFLSHHIGDLENYETLRSFENGVAQFERLFRVQPQAICYDLHPDYLAARYALERAERERLPAIGVQHHHAHIAAGMIEQGLRGEQPVIGVAFDGTGYGDDGAIWGGEFLIANYTGYHRAYHLDYIPLPGSDKAVREPWRIALAWLDRAGIEWTHDLPAVRTASEWARGVLRQQLERGVNSPPTSSMGRLFDAIAALAGVRQRVSYEAQAAIELEMRVDANEAGAYEFEVRDAIIDPVPVIRAVVDDLRDAVPVAIIAARFHNGVAALVRRVCVLSRQQLGLNAVVLSGGVWQNITLLTRAVELLRNDGFTVYIHHQVPTNDGGLALGQAAVAIAKILNPKSEI
ncbi:MAG: carbamoyltransferase HypF [Chloroflexi bacterium]|nr:carbamoyltransferase HypF [Chloroflexota bacterium]